MKLLDVIRGRRSIRQYDKGGVDPAVIDHILEAARWAPSGLNNQPWKFLIITENRKKNTIASFTKYSKIIQQAPVCICVFLDKKISYQREKDIMAVGACIQNMLLAAYEENTGSCWLGEILNQRDKVESFLNVPERLELMAVITLGKPVKREKGTVTRKKISELLI